MNKNLFRIVFNRVRGMRMVVQETAVSCGKAGSGETVSNSGPLVSGASAAVGAGAAEAMSGECAGPVPRSFIPTWAALSMAAAATFGLVPVHAQIVANPQAPGSQRPTVLPGANGVTVVDIVTPSAAGVSRNRFTQFDVNAAGAVLNNSRTNVQTTIGGFVTGNPWLAKGTANVILGEVESVNPS
ncbi:MAG: hypothetical protein JWQ11_1946, partial [Rhizobacter sp.]|nr:hypothetical protein [Rhizobacter sp.]